MSNFIVLGYTRVSTENQIENYSIDEQVERIKSYCAAKGWTLAHTYIDRGYSGGNTDRPGLQKMLEAVRKHEADAIVVYKLDRLSRSQKDTLTLIEDELLSNGVDFISINENFDTSTPFGRAMIGILSVFAQLEKDQITERFTMGRIGRGKAGFFHGGGNAPTGYDYTDGHLIINVHGERQVHQIFDMFTAGLSINAIYRRMQDTYSNENWSAIKVSCILRNTIYIGKVKFAGQEYDGQHEPIIPLEQFQDVQKLLAKRPIPVKTPFRAEYLLTGLVRCARCGARYSANHGYYKCYSRAKSCARFIKDPNCRNDNWKIEELDNYVISAIRKICNNRKELEAVIEKKRAPKREKDSAIQKKIAKLDKQVDRLVELFQISDIPIESLTGKIQALRSQRTELERELGEQQGELSPFEERVHAFAAGFNGAELEAQRLLVSSVVEKVEINGQKVDIEFRV